MPLKNLAAAAAALLSLLCAGAVLAQSYPTQPVKILVGFPPGGTTDVIGRLVGAGTRRAPGKSFLVENRPGASGSIGGAVAKSAPDGHTLVWCPAPTARRRALYAACPTTRSELVPVALVASTPYVFVVHPYDRGEYLPAT